MILSYFASLSIHDILRLQFVSMKKAVGGSFPELKTSAVIPVFNEEHNVHRVVDLLLKVSEIDEVICVNDGSTDKSHHVLSKYNSKVKLVSHSKNRGKGYALAKGAQVAKGDIVLFLDADLINLTKEYVRRLINPLRLSEARVCVGIPSKDLIFPPWVNKISGQRAYFRNDLLPYLNDMAKTGFGVEMFLNYAFKNRKIKKVKLEKLDHVWKHQKYSRQQAVKGYVKMITEIALAMAKAENILPAEYKEIFRLKTAKDITQYLVKISQIKNPRVKKLLNKSMVYIKKYLLAEENTN